MNRDWRKFIAYCAHQRSLVRKFHETDPAQANREASRIENAGIGLKNNAELIGVLKDPAIRVKDLAIIRRNVVKFFGVDFWNDINGT